MAVRKDRYSATRLKQQAKDAKALQRKLETRKSELKRKQAFERREAQRQLKDIQRLIGDLQRFVEDVEAGEYADKEARATFEAVKALTKAAKDWAKNPEGPSGPEAIALALALLVAQVAKITKKATTESKKR